MFAYIRSVWIYDLSNQMKCGKVENIVVETMNKILRRNTDELIIYK